MSRKFKIALVAGIVVVGYVVARNLAKTPAKKEERKASSRRDDKRDWN